MAFLLSKFCCVLFLNLKSFQFYFASWRLGVFALSL